MSLTLTLSKTGYMNGINGFLKSLYNNAATEDSPAAKKQSQAAIDAARQQGTRIGELGREYFEGGVLVPADFTDIKGAEQATLALIAAGEETLFEATAINPDDGTYCMLDVLRKVPGSDEWDMVEVKSATKVKPDYVEDLAFQRYVFESAGYKIRNCYVLHVDNNYVRGADIDPQGFFKLEDVTKQVEKKLPGVGKNVRLLLAHQSNAPVVDQAAIAAFVGKIKYPVYFLDYETVASGVPLYEGTKPYQQVPFQFSLHVQDRPGAEIRHVGFLHEQTTDPRRDFAEALIQACGRSGSVIVYSQSFEETRNKELAAVFPDLAKDLHAINARMIDLYTPFQQHWLYDPAQAGSASLKVVLPTYTDISYDDMAIGNGEQALQEYMAFVTGNQTDPAALAKLWTDLEEYCGQDTYAMVVLLDVLREKAGLAPANTYRPDPPQVA